MSKSKNGWFICLKNIVYASLATLGVFMVCSLVFAAALAEIDNRSIQEIAVDVIMMVMYAVFFYHFHFNSRWDTYAKHLDNFDTKKELTSYFHTDGKIILVLYSIATIITELSVLLMKNNPKNPVIFATLCCLGPWMKIKIPVIRSIITLTYSVSVTFLLAFLRSRKIYNNEKTIKKN